MDDYKNYDHLKEKVVKSERVFDGRVIQVEHATVELPDGGRSDREIVYHNGAVAIIAVHDGGMYFVRQYRTAPDAFLLEIPAGKIERGDAPHSSAARELKEEIGGEAGSLEKLHEFYVSPGFSNELVYLYEAEDLEIESQSLDDDEFLDVEKIPLGELRQKLSDGMFKDAKTVIAIQHVLAGYNL